MTHQGFHALQGKRVLLLQGPVGPFFSRLGRDLRGAGAQVFKVNFNGGDWLFSSRRDFAGVFNYTGGMAQWPRYFSRLIKRLGIDVVMLFGDCRPIHAEVVAVSRECGVEVGVFEEGYLRPDHITLERGGVNRYSPVPDDPQVYLGYKDRAVPQVQSLGSTFRYAALWAMMYFLAASLLRPFFRRYHHHRRLTWLEGLYWVRSYVRKKHYREKERGLQDMLCGPRAKQYFLVALQSAGDAQVRVHSHYESIEHFIVEVVESFAGSAPADCLLVLKHHPLDRGYTDYTVLVDELVAKHGLQGRCIYAHDQYLPALLDHARGVVTINSTVGLSALQQQAPVKVCGEAMYDIQGLTFQGSLDRFWQLAHLHVPQPDLFQGFRNYLILHTQHNGSFYKKLPNVALHTGLNWTERSEGMAIAMSPVKHAATAPMDAWGQRPQYLPHRIM